MKIKQMKINGRLALSAQSDLIHMTICVLRIETRHNRESKPQT